MSVSVTLPKDNTIYGAWITYGPGDVHVIANECKSFVIGTNKSYKDKVEFSDMALIFSANGEVLFQFADGSGQCQQKTLTEGHAANAILAMLRTLKTGCGD